ncbi:MAG: prolipoprotein diacylglyceryl transferase [Dysgonamonadaceae bacterium]|jgi:prolipoprotein diacylglyceryl transferase|nr:prolipoprotein diacylglyceryl transferase [Dysgonamonadaceae bacterium]
MLSFITWTVDPEAFTIPGPGLEVRWYGITFALGFAVGSYIVYRMWKHEDLKEAWFDKLFFYVIVGTTVGARLGHCLFYNPDYYLANPIEILKIRDGGLASHGGTIGILIAIWLYSRIITKKNMLWTLDRLVVPVGFVAAFIRTGNLMNHEVYGHETTVPWAFRFIKNISYWEHGAAPVFSLPSHPTQIYEAFCYIVTACICMWLYWKKEAQKRQGLIFGIFLIGIFLSRFFIEFVKNDQESFEESWIINMGQILSIPFIIAGIWFIYRSIKIKNKK